MDTKRFLEFEIESGEPIMRAGLLGIILERTETLSELLRSSLGGQHFLWTAGLVLSTCLRTCAVPQSARSFVVRACVRAYCGSHFVICASFTAPIGREDGLEDVPRPFDLFGTMKRSAVGDVVELRKLFVSCGYMYTLDLAKCGDQTKLPELVRAATCTPLGVQIKCFGAGFANKCVESIGPRGKVPAEEGMPIVGVSLDSTDVLRVRRVSGTLVNPLCSFCA